jgi:hypothetical protein
MFKDKIHDSLAKWDFKGDEKGHRLMIGTYKIAVLIYITLSQCFVLLVKITIQKST